MSDTPTTKRDTLSIFERSTMARRRGQRKGYLFAKSGYWYLQYRVDTTEIDLATGKPKRERMTVPIAFSSGPESVGKREAQRIAWEEYLSKLDASSIRPSSMRTLAEFVEQRFKPDVVANLKPNGRDHYEFILRRHVLPSLGATKLREIGAAHCQTVINKALQQGLSSQTALHIKNCLSAILRHAKAMQWFAGELPTEYVRIPELKRKEKKALHWDQVCAISKASPEPLATLVPFLALTGLRIGEAMGLRWKWLNLTEEPRIVGAEVIPPMCVAVRENFVKGQYQSLKSSKSSRNIPIPAWFAPRLLEWFAAAQWRNPDDPVFAAECGRPLDAHNEQARRLKPRSGQETRREVMGQLARVPSHERDARERGRFVGQRAAAHTRSLERGDDAALYARRARATAGTVGEIGGRQEAAELNGGGFAKLTAGSSGRRLKRVLATNRQPDAKKLGKPGKIIGLLSRGSQVRVLPRLPVFPFLRGFFKPLPSPLRSFSSPFSVSFGNQLPTKAGGAR